MLGMSNVRETQGKKKRLKIEDDKPHKVCAYCRVSTDAADQRNSLKAQQKFFESYFSSHPNWSKVDIYHDDGISGTSKEKRDGFNEMMRDALNGKIDVILTKEVSRFSRNVEELLSDVKKLRDNGVYVWFLSDNICTEDIEYLEPLSIAGNSAQSESLRTSRRVKWGQQHRMKQGVVFGRKEMYGYNIVKDEDDIQHFEIIPEEAEVIKKIFEWFASGEGTYRIGRRLEQQGIETKRYKNGWSNTVILRILRNEKYVGDLEQGKTYTPNPMSHKKKYNTEDDSYKCYITDHHPESAIIDRELWNKVQTILQEKAPSEEIKAKHSNRYWTSGKVYCGLCGGRYVSYVKKQKNIPYRAWVCFENHQRGKYKQTTLETGETKIVGCNALRVNDRVLQTAIHDIITEYIIPYRQTLLDEMKKEIAELSKPKDATKQIAKLQTALEKKQGEISKLTLGWTSGNVPDIAYYSSIGTLNKQYEDLQAQLRQMQEQGNSASTEVRIYTEYVEQLESVLALSENDLNEAFYERITKQIFVYPLNLLEFHLSFIPMPIYMQYKTSGRGKEYTAEFNILSKEQFAELLEKAPKNEITETE